MFFAALKKNGRPLEASERQSLIDTVRAQVMFPEAARVFDVSPAPCSLVVGVSNEPEGGFWEAGERAFFISGYCNDRKSLDAALVDLRLAEHIAHLSGRFSLLVVDRKAQRFALATPPARVDSIFRAENSDFVFWGNQASLLSILKTGELRFSPRQLMTLIDASYFGNDATPYEGVDAIGSFTTILVEQHHVTQRSRALWTLKDAALGNTTLRSSLVSTLLPRRDFARAEPQLERLASSLRDAFKPLAAQTDNKLALTGGLDSRLLLAAAIAGGVRLNCFTQRFGDANGADVWVARRVAEIAGVEHKVQERAHPNRAGRQEKQVDLMSVTKQTLKATDGMLGVRYPVTRIKPYTTARSLSGQGGEILRGGWGEKERLPASIVLSKRWNHFPKLYRPELVQQHEADLKRRLAHYPSNLSSRDVLDCIYVDLRCGRWAAASTSASTTRIRPLLDNAVVSDALALPTRLKHLHAPHRRLIELLMPALREVPLANKHWHDSNLVERLLCERRWPQAFSEAPSWTKRKERTLDTEKEALIKRYVFDEDRLSLLEPVLRVDAVRSFVKKAPKDFQRYDQLLAGLFSVCVLLSENWRQ